MIHWMKWPLGGLRRLQRRMQVWLAKRATERELQGMGPDGLWDIGIAPHQISDVAAGLMQRAETPAKPEAEPAKPAGNVIALTPLRQTARACAVDGLDCCAA